jgi:hypothetical protein
VIDPLRPVGSGLDPVQPPVAPQRTVRERREEDERRRRHGRTHDDKAPGDEEEPDDELPHVDVRA